MRNAVTALLIICCIAAVTEAEQLKVPDGCRPAQGAKPGPEGYANRIIHQKTGIELILMPTGDLTMGPARLAYQVTISTPFYMGKTVVTNAQYRRFVKASGYEGKADVDPDPDYDMYLRHWRGKSIMSDEDDYPVVWVSWKNASAFCRWAGLSLPSEAQWEYACRAGTTTSYYFGDDLKEFDKYGWANSSKEHHTHPVAGKLPNGWGLYDMAGNVWEWVEDGYLTYDHAWANSSKEYHPVAGKLPTGWKLYNMGGSIYATKYGPPPTDGSARLDGKMTKVLKGGSWGNGPSVCGTASRLNSAPTNASSEFGFRVILPMEDGG